MKLFILGSLIVYLIVIIWTEKVRNDAKYSEYYNKDKEVKYKRKKNIPVISENFMKEIREEFERD